MTDFTIPAAVIEKATAGAVDKKMLVNWADRRLWLTDLQPAERGKPRLYSYANALEACLTAAMTGEGFTRAEVKNAITWRGSARPGRNAVGYAADSWNALADLPEWEWPTAWWAIIASQGEFSILPSRTPEVPNHFRGVLGVRLINVGAVRDRLKEAMA